jgi:hypothetical protein
MHIKEDSIFLPQLARTKAIISDGGDLSDFSAKNLVESSKFVI